MEPTAEETDTTLLLQWEGRCFYLCGGHLVKNFHTHHADRQRNNCISVFTNYYLTYQGYFTLPYQMTWLCYFEGLFLSYPVSSVGQSGLRNKMRTNDNWITIQEQLGNNHDLHIASSKDLMKPQAQWRMGVTSWYKRQHSQLQLSHIKNTFHKTAFLFGTFLCPSINSSGVQLGAYSMKFLKAMVFILNYILWHRLKQEFPHICTVQYFRKLHHCPLPDLCFVIGYILFYRK